MLSTRLFHSPPVTKTMPPRNRQVVIAIDDEPDNLDLVVRTLTRKYEVRAFTKPEDGLAEALRSEPIAMVVDHRMPGMTGVELVKRARENGINCAILMVTAFPELDEITFAAQKDLLYQVVPKPYRPERLRDWIRLAVLETKMARRENRPPGAPAIDQEGEFRPSYRDSATAQDEVID